MARISQKRSHFIPEIEPDFAGFDHYSMSTERGGFRRTGRLKRDRD